MHSQHASKHTRPVGLFAIPLRAALLLFITFSMASQAQPKLYWIENGTQAIRVARADSNFALDVVTNLVNPTSLFIDATNSKVYWSSVNPSKLSWANLDGSDVADLITTMTNPVHIELDPTKGKVYWTDHAIPGISRCSLDGSALETRMTGLTVFGFDIDPPNGHVYASEHNPLRIARIKYNGQEHITVIPLSPPASPEGVATDLVNRKVYWADPVMKTIQRANMDGTGVETVLSATDGLVAPNALALNVDAGRMYVSDPGQEKILIANLDGSDLGNFRAVQGGAADLVYVNGTANGAAPLTTVPNEIDVANNYPNPFHGGTIIPVTLAHAGLIRIVVRDVLGRTVFEQSFDVQQAGSHHFPVLLSFAIPGAYYFTVSDGVGIRSGKMLLTN